MKKKGPVNERAMMGQGVSKRRVNIIEQNESPAQRHFISFVPQRTDRIVHSLHEFSFCLHYQKLVLFSVLPVFCHSTRESVFV